MSQLTRTGGSRMWRATVAYVLARDGYVCRMLRAGQPCGAPATTANHIVPRIRGGNDELSNLEAACVPCNMGAGAKLRGKAAAAIVAHHNALAALVSMLDAKGVPHDVRRRHVQAAIVAYGAHPYTLAQIDAAVRYRTARGPLMRI
jgi:5-methylcytosine-specific restriction protein A